MQDERDTLSQLGESKISVSRRAVLGAAAALSLSALAPERSYADEPANGGEPVANSWRYENGEPIEGLEPDGDIAVLGDGPRWGKNSAGEWCNSLGDPIPGALLRGIDVSEWQGQIDWAAVKAGGVDYAIVRAAAYAGRTDKYWSRNASECERLGIPYGVYIYSYATTTHGAAEEADYVLSLIKGHNPTYPIYIDIEDKSAAGSDLNAVASAFCQRVESAGYRAGVYSSLSWWNSKLTSSALNAYSRWVAQWNVRCDYAGTKDMWQATSSGSISGINGNVDVNFDFVGLSNLHPEQKTWSRVYGARHLETMAAVAREGWARSGTVVIATNSSYHDALAASALAGAFGCPVLITNPGSLAPQAKAEIQRLGASRAVIVGGVQAVSASVEGQVRAAGCATVERVQGANGQATARAIASRIAKEGKLGKTCVVATASTFQDALSVSPYAYWAKAPIFLCEFGSNALSGETLRAIRDMGFTDAVVVGGAGAVSPGVEGQLKGSAGVSSVTRLWGATASETSAAIANWELKQGMNAARMGVATGAEHYDALAGGPLCGRNGSVLVIAFDYNRSCLTGFVPTQKGKVERGYVFGGPAAFSINSWNTLMKSYFS